MVFASPSVRVFKLNIIDYLENIFIRLTFCLGSN